VPVCSRLRVQAQNPECKVVVGNCYGEFIEEREPPAVVRPQAQMWIL